MCCHPQLVRLSAPSSWPGRYFSLRARHPQQCIIPTYVRGAFATANPIAVMLFWFEVHHDHGLRGVFLQFVYDECNSGICGTAVQRRVERHD